MVMVYGGCGKCGGNVIDQSPYDDPLCITCGWRDTTISEDAQLVVDKRMGKDTLGSYEWDVHKKHKGKPSLTKEEYAEKYGGRYTERTKEYNDGVRKRRRRGKVLSR